MIIFNGVKCKKCGDILESSETEKTIYCSCRSVGVKGGQQYIEHIGNSKDFIDLSKTTKDTHTTTVRAIPSKPQILLYQERKQQRKEHYKSFRQKIKEKYSLD